MAMDQIKLTLEEIRAKAARGAAYGPEIERLTARLERVETRTTDVEQEFAAGGSSGRLSGGGGGGGGESWGQQFVQQKASALNTLAREGSGKVGLEVRNAVTTGSSSGGALSPPWRDGSPVMMPRRRLTVRNLLPVVEVSTGSVEYVEQTTRPSAANVVSEGAQKPESQFAAELKSLSLRVIAHWVKASRQALDDAPMLMDLIDQELVYGLMLKEEDQLLLGDGTGINLSGLTTGATAYSDPLSLSGATEIDTIGAAMLQCSLNDFTPSGVVVHPSDWMRMRLKKDADGRYILGDPGADVEPRLFGVPVVPTQAMPQDEFLVGSFEEAATLYDRWTPRVEVGYVDDDFTKNLVTILGEERIGLATKQAGALIYGDFGNISG